MPLVVPITKMSGRLNILRAYTPVYGILYNVKTEMDAGYDILSSQEN